MNLHAYVCTCVHVCVQRSYGALAAGAGCAEQRMSWCRGAGGRISTKQPSRPGGEEGRGAGLVCITISMLNGTGQDTVLFNRCIDFRVEIDFYTFLGYVYIGEAELECPTKRMFLLLDPYPQPPPPPDTDTTN